MLKKNFIAETHEIFLSRKRKSFCQLNISYFQARFFDICWELSESRSLDFWPCVPGRDGQAAGVTPGVLLQVFTLLWIADWMVHHFWRKGKDPDSFSIPYLTALGDLLGTALLALSFHFLWLIGDRDGDVGD